MTPKEKSEELVHRFDIMQTYIEEFTFEDAKQCALIAVDEILRVVCQCEPYWQKVKIEIQKL